MRQNKTQWLIKTLYILVVIFFVLQNPLFFIFIALHEIGHLMCGQIRGYEVKKFTLLPFGFSLCFKEVFIKPRDNIIISLFGPLTNLIFFGVFYIIYIFYPYEIFKTFIDINLSLLVFNLIPVGFLDGGRILKEVLSTYVSFYLANLIINLNGIIFGCIMLMLSIYTISITSKVIIILIAFSLIINSLINIKWIKINVIKELLHKRFRKNYSCKKLKKKYYNEDTKVFKIMKNFSYNVNYTIYIKGNNETVFTDKQIINIYFTKGNITLKRCFSEHRRSIDDKFKR